MIVRGSGGASVFCLTATLERRVPLEGQAARQHLEEDDAQRVDVRARVGLLALDLLGRHVLGRPDHHAGARDPLGLDRAGDPEIHDPGVAVAVDHDVLGLEVAVDDAQAVGFRQALADLPGDG